MNGSILILQNISREGPGLIETVLREQGIGYVVADLSRGDTVLSPEQYSAVIVLGGPDSANDGNEKITHELGFINDVLRKHIPYLGVCLGLQLLVKAAGGSIVSSPVKEHGVIDPEGNRFTVELTEAGSGDPLFDGLERSFEVFHLHGETVELTSGMKLLAVGRFCRNQIVKIGTNAYGLQGHFELTPEMFEAWVEEDPDLGRLDKNDLRVAFGGMREEYSRRGRLLVQNFLKTAGFKI